MPRNNKNKGSKEDFYVEEPVNAWVDGGLMPLFFMPKGRNQYEQDSRTPSYFDDYEKNKTINFIKKCLDFVEPKELVQIS